MNVFTKTSFRYAGGVTLIFVTFAAWATAQENKYLSADKGTSKKLVQRFFWEDYTPPSVQSFDLSGDAALDAMIKDGKIELTTEDAIRLALENNVDINVERYSPYSSLWNIDRSKSTLAPTLSFLSNLNRMTTPAASLLQGANTVFNMNTLYDILLHKPFEPGLDVDVEFKTTRMRSNNSFSAINPSFTPNLSLTLTQHLLKDFGRVTRSRPVLVARNNYHVSVQDFITRVTDIVTNVLNVYWDLVYAQEDIKVKEASLKAAQIVLDQNRIQAQVGTMAPLDVIQAEAEAAARNQQLVVARYNRKITEEQLKKLLSSRQDAGIITATLIPLSKPDPPPQSTLDVTEAIKRAMENRPELKRQQIDLENKQLQVDFTKNQLRPTLDLSASYSQNGLGGITTLRDFSKGFLNPPLIGIIPGGFWDSMSSLFTRQYLGYAVGLSFRVPVGNNDARASNAQARVDLRQSEERLRSQRQQISLQVRQALENIELNQASVTAAEVTVRYQAQRLQGEQDKYSLGSTTTRSIIEAQRDLDAAQGILLQSKIQLIKSRINLDKALGEIFPIYGIEIKNALKQQ